VTWARWWALGLRLTATILAGAIAIGSVAACTGSAQRSAAEAQRSAPAATPLTSGATLAPSVPTIVVTAPPASEPGLTTLVLVPPRQGGTSVATISVRAGELLVTVLCTGGQMIIHAEPVATSNVTCADTLTPVRNVHALGSPSSISIWVEASEDVRWTLRIEQ
jgi:hypothetical protein